MPEYSEDFLRKRASSGGKDSSRKQTADRLFAQATQPPHEDDQAALYQLARFSGVANPGKEGWATADARNYGKMLLSKANPNYAPEYDEAHDGSFNLGKTLGGIAKVAAPLAGALIPGVGTLGAMAIGAGGSALGGALSGDKFDLGKTLMAGGAAAAGNKLLGNGLGGGSSNWGFGSSPNIPDAPDIHAMGSQTYTPTGKPYIPAEHVAGAPGHPGGESIWDKLGTFAKQNPGKIAQTALGGLGYLDARAQQKNAAAFNNAQLELKKRQLGMAEQDYNARSGMRNAIYSRLGQMAQSPASSSVYGRI